MNGLFIPLHGLEFKLIHFYYLKGQQRDEGKKNL